MSSEIRFCETDASAVEAEVITAYEAIAEQKLYPGDPVRLFLESLAYIIVQQRFLIDWSAKQNLVRFSIGPYLDELGALLRTTRLGDQFARTTLRFSLAAPLDWAVAIPAGTRATADGRLMWALDETAVIEPGATSVDGVATCDQAGTIGNGLVAGQINQLVDPVAYVAKVGNVAVSLGGTDVESDERFRQRVQLAPERLAVCGPAGAYRYHALTAHQDVSDAAVVSPEPGHVDVYPLCNGAPPSTEILTAVRAALTHEDVRPLTDVVRVLPPEPVAYDVDCTWWVDPGDASQVGVIQNRVAKAAQEFVAWQAARLGRDLNPSRLIAMLVEAGASQVDVALPVAIGLAAQELATVGSVRCVFGGIKG